MGEEKKTPDEAVPTIDASTTAVPAPAEEKVPEAPAEGAHVEKSPD